MWPKALSQLVELAPHVTRLLPLADRYFKDKSTGDETTRQTLDTHRAALEAKIDAQRAGISEESDALQAAVKGLSDRFGAEMGALAAAQSSGAVGVQRQLADLERHLSTTRADALAAKQATEAFDGRFARIEASQRRAQTLAIVALGLLLAVLVLLATLFLRPR